MRLRSTIGRKGGRPHGSGPRRTCDVAASQSAADQVDLRRGVDRQPGPTAAHVLALQQALGNQATQRLLAHAASDQPAGRMGAASSGGAIQRKLDIKQIKVGSAIQSTIGQQQTYRITDIQESGGMEQTYTATAVSTDGPETKVTFTVGGSDDVYVLATAAAPAATGGLTRGDEGEPPGAIAKPPAARPPSATYPPLVEFDYALPQGLGVLHWSATENYTEHGWMSQNLYFTKEQSEALGSDSLLSAHSILAIKSNVDHKTMTLNPHITLRDAQRQKNRQEREEKRSQGVKSFQTPKLSPQDKLDDILDSYASQQYGLKTERGSGDKGAGSSLKLINEFAKKAQTDKLTQKQKKSFQYKEMTRDQLPKITVGGHVAELLNEGWIKGIADTAIQTAKESNPKGAEGWTFNLK